MTEPHGSVCESRGIGLVGLGRVAAVHRTAYGLYEQPLVAGCDPDADARSRFSAEVPAAQVYASIDEMLEDPGVGVVDLATPHHRHIRLPLLEKVAAAGKPVLVQKPLAMSYAEALEVAELLEQSGGAGTVGMVNQNMCFVPTALALQQALLAGRVVGEPSYAQIQMQYRHDAPAGPANDWRGWDERWWTVGLTVHHFGLLQLLFGPPETVFALTGRDVSQQRISDGYGHLALSYPGGLQVLVVSTGTYYGAHPVPHGNEAMWVQGPDGLLDWRPAEDLILSRRTGNDSEISRQTLASTGERKWFPDAFGLVMVHLQQALASGREPLCSVQDNLYVMAVVEATYLSGVQRRPVALKEIMGERYDANYGTGWSHGFNEWQPPTTSSKETNNG